MFCVILPGHKDHVEMFKLASRKEVYPHLADLSFFTRKVVGSW